MMIPSKSLTSFIIFTVTSMVTADISVSSSKSLDKMLSLRQFHGSVIPINSDIFKNYVKSPHQDYSVVVMFTALKPQFRCEVCPDAKREFSILASSYTPDSLDTKPIFFVVVDYYDSAEAFKIMKLQHVPGFYFFPGGRKRTKSDAYSARRSGHSAVAMAKWLADVGGIRIKVSVPTDYSKLTIPLLFVLVAAILAYFKPNLMAWLLGNKPLWGISIMVVVLLMTSGQMWNHIRKPAEAGRNGNDVQYIMGSRSGQYILESYIVMAINFAVTSGFIILNEAQAIKHGTIKKAAGVIGLGLVVVCFGMLISIFRQKSRGYPYSFLFE